MEKKVLPEADHSEEPRKILDFYSGIGGMRYSMLRAGIRATVLEAFDINNIANDVYQHNFGHRPYQGNIQSLTAIELDKYRADAWLLSPPCQPYTRQGLQKDSDDARASSFLKILELVQQMLHPPLMLFVENVVGFETSDTHKQMMEILAKTGFLSQEYILSPVQFNIPYSRPRYFCLAKRKPASFQNPCFNRQLLWTPTPALLRASSMVDDNRLNGKRENLHLSCEPIKNFLELNISFDHESKIEESDISCEPNDFGMAHRTITCQANFEDSPDSDERIQLVPIDDIISLVEKKNKENGVADGSLNLYRVPLELIERWGSAMGIHISWP